MLACVERLCGVQQGLTKNDAVVLVPHAYSGHVVASLDWHDDWACGYAVGDLRITHNGLVHHVFINLQIKLSRAASSAFPFLQESLPHLDVLDIGATRDDIDSSHLEPLSPV